VSLPESFFSIFNAYIGPNVILSTVINQHDTESTLKTRPSIKI
jgi:hypothetical protein